ncbi:hypothetical protein Mapa_012685 [Marchantia paleacea]|nr:hypothetical protein Mapa_012685 [Marchantia paleacea]
MGSALSSMLSLNSIASFCAASPSTGSSNHNSTKVFGGIGSTTGTIGCPFSSRSGLFSSLAFSLTAASSVSDLTLSPSPSLSPFFFLSFLSFLSFFLSFFSLSLSLSFLSFFSFLSSLSDIGALLCEILSANLDSNLNVHYVSRSAHS